jgi:hypothetical protein
MKAAATRRNYVNLAERRVRKLRPKLDSAAMQMLAAWFIRWW